ncbi:MAG: inner rane transporter RhtA [Thermoleophilaceae bacterium]|jgi:inner membrane transporter RhtA|nr:inner rane transporter RhtA [Thermoleophilaceae bacterium]
MASKRLTLLSRARAVPAPAFVVVGIASTQAGSAVAKTLFDDLGPAGTAFLRVALAAVLLAAIWRPRIAHHSRRDLLLAAAFGLALCAMNFTFYEAISRIPLGIAVTIEFAGPLAVAVAGSRRALDGLWVVLAAAGILLLARGGGDVQTTGVLLALLAGAFWACYILLSARAGQAFAGGSGLAVAMVVGGVVLLPVGVAGAGSALLDPGLVAAGAGVALLASAIPYSLELEALRRLPTRVFGILMSLEPAIAALAGFVILGEGLGAREIVAIGLVAAASLGASLSAEGPTQPLDG